MFKSKKLLAILGGAMVAAVGVVSVALFHDGGGVQAAQQGRFQCIGTFEATTLPGSRDLSVFGDITLDMGRDITGVLETHAEVHDPVTTERTEHGVVESRAGGDIGTLDRQVIEHGSHLALDR